MEQEDQLFQELSFYTLSHPDSDYFIHQHAVDAFAVQHASDDTKTIKFVYGLTGLCLYLQHGFTGKEVQIVHMELSSDKTNWPKIYPITEKIDYSIQAILDENNQKKRDDAIQNWCQLIWDAHKANHNAIREWLKLRQVIK